MRSFAVAVDRRRSRCFDACASRKAESSRITARLKLQDGLLRQDRCRSGPFERAQGRVSSFPRVRSGVSLRCWVFAELDAVGFLIKRVGAGVVPYSARVTTRSWGGRVAAAPGQPSYFRWNLLFFTDLKVTSRAKPLVAERTLA